ncbi:hypothetical protein [Haladaptatus sp. CMAA 1911]|uniref:hypothetical protein n=1 Tax=unclassified Haladaptatus TaxID=2622732 RepID=UPI003754E410
MIQKRIPTSRGDFRVVTRTVRLVLSIPRYFICSVLASLIGLSIFVLSQNTELFQTLLFNDFLTLQQRITIFSQLFPIIGTAFSPIKEAVLLITSGLFGINLSMSIYHLKEHNISLQSGTGSAVGVIFGTLGAGCAACGSVVLTGFLSFIGATSILTLLPFDGLSFSIISLVIFGLSIYWISSGMRGGTINGCPVDI